MHNTFNISDDLVYIGVSNRKQLYFENSYPITDGMAYNSYLLLDKKTVLFDTVDSSVEKVFLENLDYALGGRELDYLIVQHMEPDHISALATVLKKYPNAEIYGTRAVPKLIEQFFGVDINDRFTSVKDGDTLETGRHKLNFITAPMVHWPEVMMTYDDKSKTIFSADAFGTFGALDGNIFSRYTDHWHSRISNARRYYASIVGKYGNQVKAALKKLSKYDIFRVCPLHGPIIEEDLSYCLDKYDKWSSYTPEGEGVMIAYGSIYGGTEQAANIIATKLAKKGLKDIKVYNVANVHYSKLIAESFRCKTLVIASATHDSNLFSAMDVFLRELARRNFQKRQVAILENGTWAPGVIKNAEDIFSKMKDITVIAKAGIKSTVHESDEEAIDNLVEEIYKATKN
jgi:flavorubredoxin